ncbi:MAG: cell division protein ZapA [Acidobacteria bacterium]|nr:cell division protein ZapA [Acidobacteriota bacterium]MCB9398680.1 cell division protein ZapA [Acidobacteriota bacterium]
MAEGRRHHVELGGRIYSLRSPESDETIQAIANLVRDKMSQIEEATGTVDSLKLGILTALNLADDFLKIQKEYDAARAAWATEQRELVALIQHHLQSDSNSDTPA